MAAGSLLSKAKKCFRKAHRPIGRRFEGAPAYRPVLLLCLIFANERDTRSRESRRHFTHNSTDAAPVQVHELHQSLFECVSKAPPQVLAPYKRSDHHFAK